MAETILLTLIGGACGLGVAAGGIRLLSVLGANQLPLGAQITFDAHLAIVAMIGAAITGIFIGSLISWFNLRGCPSTALHSESRTGTASHGAQRLRHSFVVAQVALAFVLLTGGGLLGLSLKHVMAVNPGFPPDHTLTGRITLPWKSYPDWPQRLAFIDRLMDQVRSQPGVAAVGVINNIPFSGDNSKTAFTVKGRIPKPGESIQAHYFYGVEGDVFAALGIPLREGRFLRSADSGSKVCVVDEDFARRYWPKGEVIGQHLFMGGAEGSEQDAFEVVGVTGAMKQAGLTENQRQGAVYFPYKFRTDTDVFAVVRTIQPPESFALTLQKAVRGIDPDLPLSDLRSMELRIADTLIVRRGPALLATIFAVVALLLAAVGTYGVLAYAVNQRRREIGVRMALGALPKQVGNHFLYVGLRLLSVGTVLGLLGAWLAGRAMQSVLFGVPPLPLAIIASAVLIMSVVSVMASWLPARQAARVDPMEALRYE